MTKYNIYICESKFNYFPTLSLIERTRSVKIKLLFQRTCICGVKATIIGNHLEKATIRSHQSSPQPGETPGLITQTSKTFEYQFIGVRFKLLNVHTTNCPRKKIMIESADYIKSLIEMILLYCFSTYVYKHTHLCYFQLNFFSYNKKQIRKMYQVLQI